MWTAPGRASRSCRSSCILTGKTERRAERRSPRRRGIRQSGWEGEGQRADASRSQCQGVGVCMHSIAAWQHWIVSIVTPLRCTLWSPKPGLGCTRPYCPGHAVGINSMGGSQTHQTPAAQSSAAMHSVTGTLSNENVAWLPWAQSWAVAGEISASAAKAKARYSMLKMKGTACGARMELSTVQVVGSIERHVVRQDAGSPSCAGDGVLCSEAVGVAGTDVRQLGGGEWAAKCDQRNRIIASFLNSLGLESSFSRTAIPDRVPEYPCYTGT